MITKTNTVLSSQLQEIDIVISQSNLSKDVFSWRFASELELFATKHFPSEPSRALFQFLVLCMAVALLAGSATRLALAGSFSDWRGIVGLDAVCKNRA